MRDKVLLALERYQMLPPGSRVTVALSGGADSTALLHLLCGLAKQRALTVQACHINHLLRGEESQRDEAFVRQMCRDWQVPLTVFQEDVESGARQAGESVELFGRRVRYQRLLEAAQGGWVATAHTLSDRAETMMLNLLRGTGLKGICAIPPVNGRVIRPLFLCTRQEVEAYCRENGLAYVEDSSNLSNAYTRNRVRMEVIPALRSIQPAFELICGRALEHLAQDEDFLEREAEKAFREADCGGALAAQALGQLHPAIRFRVLRRYLTQRGLPCDAAHIQAVEQMLQAGKGQVQIQKGWWLKLHHGRLWASGELDAVEMEPVAVGPGELPHNPLTKGRLLLVNCEQFTNLQKRKCNILKKAIDYDKICGRLFLRQKRQGDYLRSAQRGVGKPLRKWWNEAKVAPHLRSRIPVFCDERSVVWVPGLGADARVVPTAQTTRFLVVELEEEGQ